MIAFVQGWLLEGAYATYTTDQLLFGWSSEIAAKANGGDFWQGADFSIDSIMTPILNDQMGVVATAQYGLYSGSFETDDVCAYRLVNGEAFVNKI